MFRIYYYTNGKRYTIKINDKRYDALLDRAKQVIFRKLEDGITDTTRLENAAFHAIVKHLSVMTGRHIDKLTPSSTNEIAQIAQFARMEAEREFFATV